MKNFYYVISFNLTNPRVKTLLDKRGITEMSDTMLDFKIRSKLFVSYSEASSKANEDFSKKLKAIYDDGKDHNIRHISVINPAFALPGNDLMMALAERFGGASISNWDDNCCGVIFFADMGENDSTDDGFDPNSWMFKYEILFTEDSIELSGNGDFIFSQMNVASGTSTYH